jgi:two-component system, chemotaxis family, protein-glutamate methylesterase/glutaminase
MSEGPIRVLIVDDSAFARKVVREVLQSDPLIEVVDIARDGLDALEKIAQLKPDVVTLDLVMPNLDGLGVLKALPSLALAKPPRVVIVSMAEDDSDLVVSALQNGAVDFVHKPTALATDRLFELRDELRTKVFLAAEAAGGPAQLAPEPLPWPANVASLKRRIVVMGASTGGPQALTTVLGALPEGFPVPIAVALHMPVGYTEALARRLNQTCAIEVVEAYEGVEMQRGRAVVARAGQHLRVERGVPPVGRLTMQPYDKVHRPSVDVLFSSAAAAFGDRCVGVVMTGMGDDGLEGARALRAAGSVILSEAQSSCVVYGMPRCVEAAGLSTAVVPLDGMARAIRDQLMA